MTSAPVRPRGSRRGNVRSLERGLELLRLVNEEGGVRPAIAARILRMPRPTAYRLLETLEELGYVQRSPSDCRFCVTLKAQLLSGGYDTDVQLSEIAGPILSRLLTDLVWPVHIMTQRGGMMVVRETTTSRSPLSIDRDMVGRETPMLRTAAGRVYLAFCPDQERREILDCLRTMAAPDDERYLIPDAVERMLTQCRKNGYGSRLNEPYMRKTSSVALPIMVEGNVKACVTVLWQTSAVPAERAVKQFVPRLAEAAELLSQHLTSARWSAPEAALSNPSPV